MCKCNGYRIGHTKQVIRLLGFVKCSNYTARICCETRGVSTHCCNCCAVRSHCHTSETADKTELLVVVAALSGSRKGYSCLVTPLGPRNSEKKRKKRLFFINRLWAVWAPRNMSNILLRPCCTIARNCVVVRAPDLFYHPPTIVVLSVPSVLFMLSSILMVTFFPLQSHEDPCFFFHDARMSYSTTPCTAVLLTKILPSPNPTRSYAASCSRCCKML